MGLLIDTSVAVDILDDSLSIKRRRAHFDKEVFVSVVTRVELEAGIYREARPDTRKRRRLDEFMEQVQQLSFTAREVDAYASIIAEKGFSRRLVVDRMIAATAIANNLALATLNPRDVRDISGLTIEDWSK